MSLNGDEMYTMVIVDATPQPNTNLPYADALEALADNVDSMMKRGYRPMGQLNQIGGCFIQPMVFDPGPTTEVLLLVRELCRIDLMTQKGKRPDSAEALVERAIHALAAYTKADPEIIRERLIGEEG